MIALPGFRALATLPFIRTTLSSELVQLSCDSLTFFSFGFTVAVSPSSIRPTFAGNLMLALVCAAVPTGSVSNSAIASRVIILFLRISLTSRGYIAIVIIAHNRDAAVPVRGRYCGFILIWP